MKHNFEEPIEHDVKQAVAVAAAEEGAFEGGVGQEAGGKGGGILPISQSLSPTASTGSTKKSSKKRWWTNMKANMTLPVAVYFILGNEFCERFSFYGMKTILPPYLVHLGLTESSSTIVIHAFIFFAYFVTLLGGLLADTVLGKFKTILWLSGVYCIGNVVLSVTSIPLLSGFSGTAIGLVLIAFGTGGIKPCVSTFGGDQFGGNSQVGDEEADVIAARKKAAFFSFFYFAINAGSLLSMAVTPVLKTKVQCFNSTTCYPLAFGVPAVLMFIALIVFLLGYKFYCIKLPEGGNCMKETLAVIWFALRHKKTISPQAASSDTHSNGEANIGGNPSDARINEKGDNLSAASAFGYLSGNQSSTSLLNRSTTDLLFKKDEWQQSGQSDASSGDFLQGPPCLASPSPPPPPSASTCPPSFLDAARGKFHNALVDEVYHFLQIILLFLPTIFFWTLYDQQSSRWVYQGYMMNTALSLPASSSSASTTFQILPEQMQLWNAILILVFLPLFNYILYPAFTHVTGIRLTPLRKIIAGMLLEVATFLLVAAIQLRIDASQLVHDPVLGMTVCTGNCMSILWQIPQYILITASEILVSVTLLSLAYDEAPPRLKSLISAFNLLTVAFGNLFTMTVTAINPFAHLAHHIDVYNYILYAGIALIATFWLIRLSLSYQYTCKAYQL